jgi:predicted dienelactone hydrolase
MRRLISPLAGALLTTLCLKFFVSASLCWPSPVAAAEAGLRHSAIPVSLSNPEAIPVALYYPTQVPARVLTMGLFNVRVAIQAPPDSKFKGLIVVSHGTGGSELAHSSLAQALAQRGYMVAAIRHPGDNWQDRSVWQKGPGAFFVERPQHVSRVMDALLDDPEWKERIASDAHGPRIGVLGHSAGGYTAIALAGGQADLARIVEHCRDNRAEDPIFCSMVRSNQPPSASTQIPATVDKRVRAVVVLAPLGVVFTAGSLASIRIPAAVYAAEFDRWLVPRFHAEWIARNIKAAGFHRVSSAWHFTFMDRPNAPIPTADGDAAADPPGFDRLQLLARLGTEIPAFFDKAFPD